MAGIRRTTEHRKPALLYGGRNLAFSRVTSELPGYPVVVSSITYSQTSVYSANTAATNATMTNGIVTETSATATNNEANAAITMDLQRKSLVRSVVVGPHRSTLSGGWDNSGLYINNCVIEYSDNGSSWTTAGSVGTFTTDTKTFLVNFSARYIRIRRVTTNYLAVTEFYATSDFPVGSQIGLA